MTYANKAKVGETRDLIKNVEKRLGQFFPDIEKEFGFKLHFKGGSFDPEGNFVLKLEGLKIGALAPEAQRYQSVLGYMRNLPPLNTVLKMGGKEYEIVGINSTGTKVHGKRLSDGKVYLMPTAYVEEAWKYLQTGKV